MQEKPFGYANVNVAIQPLCQHKNSRVVTQRVVGALTPERNTDFITQDSIKYGAT